MYRDYDRYQFQSGPVKLYRTVRYRPKWVVISIWWIIRWLATGGVIPIETMDDGRWEFVKHLWVLGKSMTCIDTGHMHYLHEIMHDLRSQLDDMPDDRGGNQPADSFDI